MNNQPYVGITGFTQRSQIEAMLRHLTTLPLGADRRLMIGVLVSDRSLDGLVLKSDWVHKYPKTTEPNDIFIPDPRLLNLVHFNTRDPLLLADQLKRAIDMLPGLDGFQLNMAWPDPYVLESFTTEHPDLVMVLQIGRRAMEIVGCTPEAPTQVAGLVDRMQQYEGSIHYYLLDRSGGMGIPFDPAVVPETLKVLQAELFEQQLDGLWPGIAGGLSAHNLASQLADLLVAFPNLSWDAEGALHTPAGLDLELCRRYLAASTHLLAA